MRAFWSALTRKASPATPAQEIFSRIYKKNEWLFGSGEGSLPSSTKTYRDFLQTFLRERGIGSVVDIGCGDWQFSRLLDWSGITYTGIDVVPSVITKNRKYFERATIHFLHQDVLETPPPAADLLLIKDVVQHWPFEAIHRAVRWFGQYQYVLITNDEILTENDDTVLGGYRPLDLRKAPFHLPATEVFRFGGISVADEKPWTKITLLIDNNF